MSKTVTSDDLVRVVQGLQQDVSDLKRMSSRSFIQIHDYLQLRPISASSAPLNSVFLDSVTGTLKFKDAGGSIFSLY